MSNRQDEKKNKSKVNIDRTITLSDEYLDKILKSSMMVNEKPSQECRDKLIQQIYEKSTCKKEKQISLWFLPVVLNVMISCIVVVLSMIFVTNILFGLSILLSCSFSVIVTSFLTYIGMKKYNLKIMSVITL